MSKITKEELELVNDLNSKLKQTQSELGRLELVKADTLDAFKQTMTEFNGVKADLTKKYGDIVINLEDGSFEKQEEAVEEQAPKMEVVEEAKK